MKKRNFANIAEGELNDRGYEIMSPFVMARKKLIIKDDEGYLYWLTYDNFISANKLCKFEMYRPERFARRNIFTIDNINNWIKIENKTFSYVHGEYSGNQERTLYFKCLKCGEIWETCFNDLFWNKTACPYCAGKRISSTNNFEFNYPELALEWDYSKNKKKPNEYTRSSAKSVFWICQYGHKWKSKISNRAILGNGCPVCSESRGEKKVRNFLISCEVLFYPQYKFCDCFGKHKRLLIYDFFIDGENNSKYAIEYQGIQHYYSVDFFGGQKFFEKNQERDQIKRDYCKKNNINLVEIPYWDMQNINKILEKELKPLLKKEVYTECEKNTI